MMMASAAAFVASERTLFVGSQPSPLFAASRGAQAARPKGRPTSRYRRPGNRSQGKAAPLVANSSQLIAGQALGAAVMHQSSSRLLILVTVIRFRRTGSMSNCLIATAMASFSVLATTVPRRWARLRIRSTDQRAISHRHCFPARLSPGGCSFQFGRSIFAERTIGQRRTHVARRNIQSTCWYGALVPSQDAYRFLARGDRRGCG